MMPKCTILLLALLACAAPMRASEEDYHIALKIYRLFGAPSGKVIDKALFTQDRETHLPDYGPASAKLRNQLPENLGVPKALPFLTVFKNEVNEGDLSVGNANLRIDGADLEWVAKSGEIDPSPALLYETEDARNKVAITIHDELPPQYFEPREDGAYLLREANRVQGVSVTPYVRVNEAGVYRDLRLWLVSDLMIGREPLEGVRLDVGPPIFSNSTDSPSPTWANVVVSPDEGAWGCVLLGFGKEGGIPNSSLLVCVKATPIPPEKEVGRMADDAPRMTPAEKTKAVPAYAVELACITVGDSDRCQTFIDNHLQELPTGTLGETAPALLEVLGAKKLFSAYMPKEPTRKEFNGLIHEELDATLLSAPRITLTSYPTEATRAMPFKGENPPGRFIADTIARGLHPGVIADVTHYPELTPENPSVLTGLGLVPGNPKVVLRYAPEGFGPTGGLGSGGFGGGGVGPTGGFGGGGFRDRGRESAENTYVKWIDTDGDGVREPQFVFRNTNSGIASGSRQGETPEVHFRRTDVDGDGNLETVPFYESPPTAAQNGNPNLGIQSPIGTNVFPYADGEWTGFWEAVAVEPSADDENVLYVGFYTVARSKREVTKKVLLWKRSSLKFAETAWRADLSFNLTRQPLFLIGNGVWEGEQQIIMVRVRRLETTAE